MYQIADANDALITDDILAAIFEQLPLGDADDRTAAACPRSSGEPAPHAVTQLREAVMAALATARARRERHRIPPNEDRVLTAAEASKHLGLSRFTMLRMRQHPDAGGLPFIQLSQGRIGYRLRDVEAYLIARRVGRLPGEVEDGETHHQAEPVKAAWRRAAKKKPNHQSPAAGR